MVENFNIFESNEFSFLHEISNTLSSSLNLQESLSSIFELFNSKFGFMKAILTILDPATNQLKIKVSYGLNPDDIETSNFQKWEVITSRVLNSGKPLIIPHLDHDTAYFGDSDSLSEESFICIPLILGNESFGTLSVDIPFSSDEQLQNIIKLLGIVSLMIAQELRLKKLLDVEKEALRHENIILKSELEEKYKITNMIGKSGAMIKVFDSIRQVADTNASVLIRGESGTGKELVAHAIHYLSNRSDKPFIRINCGAIPESLIESELFGHKKGAFTDAVETKMGKFEAANGGTIFLDEVGELTPSLQVKLLRVLQDKEITKIGDVNPVNVDVRLIAATNKDLEKALEDKSIREDFYYRLSVFPIHLPPLRERSSDILILAETFLEKYSKESNKKISKISSSVINILSVYHWPGNVRELQNCIERAVILCNEDTILLNHLPPSLQSIDVGVAYSMRTDGSLKQLVESYEKEIILELLKKSNGNISLAARKLDTTTRILNYKITLYQINAKALKKAIINS